MPPGCWSRLVPVLSLWLVPQGEVGEWLSDCIGRLSRRFATPAFEPHLTLLGGIRLEGAQLHDKGSLLASELRPFEVRLTRPGSEEEYFLALFIEAERSRDLLAARKRALELFQTSEAGPFRPHLSVLYGRVPAEQKRPFLLELEHLSGKAFAVSRLTLFSIGGPPESWRRAGEFTLPKP